MPCYAFDRFVPVVDPTAFVHPTASLIGDVVLGPDCYVGPGASLRGDFGRIRIGRGCNIQDNCVLHAFPGEPVCVEDNGHIGHGAILHGCTVRRDALIGMHSVIMDHAEIGAESIVGAAALVREGFVVPPRSLVIGSPARVLRPLEPAEIEQKAAGTRLYQRLAAHCRATLSECTPLAAPEAGRDAAGAADPWYARRS